MGGTMGEAMVGTMEDLIMDLEVTIMEEMRPEDIKVGLLRNTENQMDIGKQKQGKYGIPILRKVT